MLGGFDLVKTLYLHVGMHKTGTSSIQSFASANREWLARQGVLYPDYGMAGDAHAPFALSLPNDRWEMTSRFATVSRSDPETPYAEYDGPSARELYTNLGRIISSTPHPKILLSSESFLAWIDPEVIAARIAAHIDAETRILIYLRRQDLWIQSVYNQVVKDPHLRYGGDLYHLPQMAMLDYAETIRRWSHAFGKERLMVRSFEPFDSGKGSIVSDFLLALGVPPDSDGDSFRTRTHPRINTGLDSRLLGILRHLNVGRVSLEEFAAVSRLFADVSGLAIPASTKVLSFDAAEALYQCFREGNRSISDEFMEGRPLFSAPTPEEYSKEGGSDEALYSLLIVRALKATARPDRSGS